MIVRLEVIGCIIAIIGCIVTSEDPSASKVDSELENIWYGNFLCTFSSIFAVIYLLKAAEVSTHMDLMHYLVLLNIIQVLIYIFVFPIIMPDAFDYSMDRETGLFGWFGNGNFIYCLAVVSFLNGCGTLFFQGFDLNYF